MRTFSTVAIFALALTGANAAVYTGDGAVTQTPSEAMARLCCAVDRRAQRRARFLSVVARARAASQARALTQTFSARFERTL